MPDRAALEGDATVLVIHLPVAARTPVDVCFDGWRTWSVALDSGERHELRWPAELARRLAGSATVTIRRAGDARVLAEGELHFGGTSAGPDLTDGSGRRLSVNKWQRLGLAFDGQDGSVRERLLDELERLIETCRRALGLDVFVSYGTLLGAVRGGRLLDHDDDADLGYLSAADNPADLALESFAHERALVAAGYHVVRHSTGHLQVIARRPDGAADFHIDLFACFVVGGTFYQAFAVAAPAADVTILPLSTVTLNGRELPAPADPVSVLTATYGPSWQVPDPAFRFSTPAAVRHRLANWLGGRLPGGLEAWESHHAQPPIEAAMPSSFAAWVHGQVPAGRPLVDVGCGDGADAAFFAAHGHPVRGLDFAAAALERARERVAAPFDLVNLHDRRAVLGYAAELARWRPDVDLYCRHVLDAVEPRGVENLCLLARAVLRGGGTAWVELRSDAPADGPPHGQVEPAELAAVAARHSLVVTAVDDTRPVTRLTVRPNETEQT